MAPIPFATVAVAPSAGQIENQDKLSGYIFMCNGKTKADCYRYRVFGLPAARVHVVEKIRPRMMLFLFDFELKLLYGVYSAISNGGLGFEPTAFGGKFLAQVRFEIFKDCVPLRESAFKHVIIDNYYGGSKFRQELSNEQVTNLMSLFRPIPKIPVPFANMMPEAELSASYDQYLAQQKLIQSRHSNNYQRSQPAHCPREHVHHPSPTNMMCDIPQQSTACFLADDQQPSFSAGSLCLQKNTYGRSAIVSHNGDVVSAKQLHSSMQQRAAAYWIAAALEDQKQASSCAPVQVSSSSSAALQCCDDLKRTYCGQDPWLPQGSTTLGVGNQPIPYSVTAGSPFPVSQSGKKEFDVLSSHAYASPCEFVVSAANASAPEYVQSPSDLSGSSSGYAYALSSSGAAAYWITEASQGLNQVNSAAYQMSSEYSRGYTYEAAPVTNERLQAYGQVPSEVPAISHRTTYYPPSNEAIASGAHR